MTGSSVFENRSSETASRNRKRVFRQGGTARWCSAAAAMLVVAAGVGYGVAQSTLGKWSDRGTVVEIPAGQRMSMTLSDGTRVNLNSGARLEYPAVFTKRERRVSVSGEAMFEVTHDARHPFIVETFACEVEVLGTRFNVVADPSTSAFSAALFEGKLKVSQNDSQNCSVILSPDEVVRLENGQLLCDKITDRDDYLWTDGVLNLDNLTFVEAMRKFETYYGIDMVIERMDLPQMKFKGKIRVSDGVDYALHLLMSVWEFNYVKSDDRNTIYIR